MCRLGVTKKLSDNLVTSVPNFTSIPNLGALTSSEEHMGDIEPAVQKPSTSSTHHTTRKRKRKTFSSKKIKPSKKLDIKKTTDSTVYLGCGRQCETGDNWIQCALCDNWYDKECQGIDEEKFANLGDDWYCKKCCE